MIVRRERPGDIAATRAVQAAAFPIPDGADEPVEAGLLDQLREDEGWIDGLSLVAEVDGEVVGLLVLDGDDVDQLYVDPAMTGQGVGSRLLARAKAERPGGLELWTFQANAGARRFYARHGFVEAARTDGDNEERAPDLRLAWRPAGS